MNYNQIEKDITAALGIMSVQDKSALVNLLQKSGSLVNETNTQEQLLDASFKAIKDSKRFRTDLADYLHSQKAITQSSGEASFTDDNYYSNFGTSRALVNKGTFADDSQWSNQGGVAPINLNLPSPTTSTTKTTTSKTSTSGSGAGIWASIGNFFSSDTGKDLTNKALGIGMDYLSTSLQNKAAKAGNQQAINYKIAEAQAAANQALANQTAAALGNTPAPSSTNKKSSWVMPVAIIGGVVVIGAIIFFVVKRKK